MVCFVVQLGDSKYIQISVKEFHTTNNMYYSNVKTYDRVDVIDISTEDGVNSLIDIVSLDVHSYYQYNDDLRLESKFKSASAIVFDFDSKGHHDNSSISDIVSSELFSKFNWVLYTSKSHDIEDIDSDCFHLAMFFDEPVTDVLFLKQIYRYWFGLMTSSGLSCDTHVSDGARLIYPSRVNGTYDLDNFEVYVNFDGDYFSPNDYTDDIYSTARVDTIPVITHKTTTPYTHTLSEHRSMYCDVFESMSDIDKYSYVHKIFKYIHTINRESEYTKLSRQDWISLGFSVDSEFGVDDGYSLFTVLSGDHPGDSIESLSFQYNNIHSTNRNVLGIDSIIKLSSKYGFNHKMYMIYYYKRIHRFSITRKHELFKAISTVLFDDVYGYTYNLYRYNTSNTIRSFLLETIKPNGTVYRKISLSTLMDISADVLGVSREYITSSVSKGVIRTFISMNGVFDYHKYIVQSMGNIDLLNGKYCTMDDIATISSDIKSWSPKSVHGAYTSPKIINLLLGTGDVLSKERIRVDGVQRTVLIVSDYIALLNVDDAPTEYDVVVRPNLSTYCSVVDVSFYYIFYLNSKYLIKRILNMCDWKRCDYGYCV